MRVGYVTGIEERQELYSRGEEIRRGLGFVPRRREGAVAEEMACRSQRDREDLVFVFRE